jgi:AcrR family transcriptional regulator
MADKADPDKTGTIVAAARKRFGHYGLAKTTMNEIASDVGMSKASLYYYFPDKEHLFLEVIRLEMENFFAEINRLTSRSIAPADQLRQYVELRFDSFKDFLNLGKLATAHFESVRSAFYPLNNDFLEREKMIIRSILESGIKKGSFEAIDVASHADLFVSVLRSLRVLVVKQRNDYLLTDDDYDQLKGYQTRFTSVFIKGISKKQL